LAADFRLANVPFTVCAVSRVSFDVVVYAFHAQHAELPGRGGAVHRERVAQPHAEVAVDILGERRGGVALPEAVAR
jgi:hypothetical protein